MKISVDGEVFEFDQSRMLNTEAIALQKVTGMKVAEWAKAMQDGDAYALTALVWLLWRRNDRVVPFDEVEFDLGALEVQDEPAPEVPTEAPAEGAEPPAA